MLLEFKNYQMNHPFFAQTAQEIKQHIGGFHPSQIIPVVGPSGIGKTVMINLIKKHIIVQYKKELDDDLSRYPYSAVECAMLDKGFSTKDFYLRLLNSFNEVLANKKIMTESTGCKHPKSTESVLRSSLEKIIRYRAPYAIIVDEFQHICMAVSHHKVYNDMNAFKSFVNCTQAKFFVFGTYEILTNLVINEQICRRSDVIHFRRYKYENKQERAIFGNIIKTMETKIPQEFMRDSSLFEDVEYFYERTLGCVGLLKEWLLRTLTVCLSEKKTRITKVDMTRAALNAGQLDELLGKILEGEERFTSMNEGMSDIRRKLGINEQSKNDKNKGSIKPGIRAEHRDPVMPDQELRKGVVANG